jgi:hypothetical protein
VSSGQDIVDAANRANPGIAKVVMLMHGSPAHVGGRIGHWGVHITQNSPPTWLPVSAFAAALAPKLASNAFISLGACQSDAVARALRDALVARGYRGSGDVRAKTTSGRTRANPNGIAYPLRPGAAGVTVRLPEAGSESIAWTCLIGRPEAVA